MASPWPMSMAIIFNGDVLLVDEEDVVSLDVDEGVKEREGVQEERRNKKVKMKNEPILSKKNAILIITLFCIRAAFQK